MVTGKELDSLATEKKEDIAKELEERAKAREPVPVETTDEAEPEKADEPETPEDAPAEGDATEEPAPSGKQEKEPEEPDLLKRLRAEPGMEKHSYKDEDALIKSHASLRKKLSSRDDDAKLGRALREAGVSPEDIAEVFRTKASPDKGKDEPGAPEWDPAWDREIEAVTDENTGKVVDYKGPPELVRKYRQYQADLDEFRRRPVKTLVDKWGLGQIIDRAVQQGIARQQGAQTFEAFMKENGDFIEENRDEIVALTDKGWPATAAVEHVKLKREADGLRTGKTAEDAKKADLERLKGKSPRRNGAATTPIRSVRDLAKMPFAEAVNAKLAESGESIPAEW